MNRWPATLPQHVDGEGYQEGTGDGRLRSQTDTGPAKVRRRFSAIPRPLAVQLKVSTAQLAIFEAFVRGDLAGGTRPFLFPAPRGGADLTVQFGEEMPSWTPYRGGFWRLQLDLVILP